ncbi:ATP-binding protein [Oleispirillum naphthae]|uniref:sensor histidine kinase n=1 Tax=Oleispirillum naphthae TaxID=2838853 RepID=UPI0030823FF8
MRSLPRLWIFALVLVLILIGFGGWRYLQEQETRARREAEDNLRAIAVLKVVEIHEWLRNRLSDAQVLASNPTINRVMRVWAMTEPQAHATWSDGPLAAVQERLLLVQEAYQYNDIRLVDGGNRLIVGIKPQSSGAEDAGTVKTLSRARATGAPAFGDFNLSAAGRPVIDVAVPLFAYDAEEGLRAAGLALVLEIDPDNYLYPLLRRWPMASRTAETLLARKDGGDVVFLTPLRHRDDAPLTFRHPADDPHLPAARALRGEADVLSGPDYRGEPVLAVGMPVPGTAWVLISKVDSMEALAAQRREALLGVWALLAAGVAVVAVTLVAWNEAVSGQRDKVLRARAAALAHEARLASIFRAAPIGIGIVEKRRFVEINESLCTLTGYLHDELIGQTTQMLYATAAEFEHAGRESTAQLAEVGFSSLETRWRHKDGHIINVLINGAPLAQEGASERVSFTITDITQRKRQERQLRRRRDELERSNKELATFAYVASHDLRSPLRGISQLAQWIVEDMPDGLPDEVAEHLRMMQSRISRMEGLLDDLLAYSRVGRIEGDIVAVDVTELCRDLFDLLAPPVGFRLELGEDLPVFSTLVTPLTLVLRNLIGNAIKHRVRDEGTIAVSARHESGVYVFTVADDGPGIPPEYHERVFGLFQTLRPRDEVEGSGMGLALVRKIVELYGGTVRLDSDGESGSRFIFTWPDESKLRETLDARNAA